MSVEQDDYLNLCADLQNAIHDFIDSASDDSDMPGVIIDLLASTTASIFFERFDPSMKEAFLESFTTRFETIISNLDGSDDTIEIQTIQPNTIH